MKFSDLKFESAEPLDSQAKELFEVAIAMAKEIGDHFEALTKDALTEGHPNHRDPRGIQTVQLAALSTVASQLIGSAPSEIGETVLRAFLRDTERSAQHTMARVDALSPLDVMKAMLAKATAEGAKQRIRLDRSNII